MPNRRAGDAPNPMGVGWLILAAMAGIGLVASLVAEVVLLTVGPRDISVLLLPATALAWWWFHRGAWLRTRWGRPPADAPVPWDEPALTVGRVWWYIWLGAACVVAASLAIGWQARSWVR